VPGAPDEPPRQPAEDTEDEIDFAGRTLRDLLTLLGLEETTIEARGPETPGDGLGRVAQVFDVSGETEDASDELGLLIGRRGETLGSLQYLLNVMVSRRYGDQDTVFGVDIEGYRRRREESLVEMAQRVADEVRETGDVITLEPMPAAERRIIHLALSEEAGVVTESVGRGNDRQVEVMPGERGADDYLSEGGDDEGDEPDDERETRARDDADETDDEDDADETDDEDDADETDGEGDADFDGEAEEDEEDRE
jgi:spoIIIJ-associated protein